MYPCSVSAFGVTWRMAPVPPAFFARDALDVAHDLIGCVLARGEVRVRLTEVEAYRVGDTANHARMGRTARNAPMWGPPGHLYVYLCYGMHALANVVCGPEGEAAAVLLRAAEPLEGHEVLRARRGRKGALAPLVPSLMDGPGKLAQALGLTVAHSGLPLGHPDAVQVLSRTAAVRRAVGPRIGIEYASPEDILAPWRVADADSLWVGKRASLRPLGSADAPSAAGGRSPA